MATIIYPIPYETVGVTTRMTRPRWFQVADKVELEIREVDSIQTLEAARANFSWPTQGLPGQGDYNEDNPRHQINPRAALRVFEDSLYAPVGKFSSFKYADRELEEPETAKPDDITKALGSFEYVLAQPFERLYKREAEHGENLFSKYQYGKLKTLDQLKLTGDSEVRARKERDEEIAAANNDLASYLVIDDDLWRKLQTEPVIAVSTIGNTVDIKLVAGVDVGADRTDYFSLSQLEECLEFAEMKYPGQRVRQQFSDLTVIAPEAFSFDGEADAVVRTARNVDRAIGRGAAWIEGEFQVAFEKVHKLVWNLEKGQPDDFAEALQKLDDTWDDEGLTSVARDGRQLLKLALSRWEMRPIRRSGPRF
jgi:hypothetical protein